MQMKYKLNKNIVDSIELKSLLISRGIRVDNNVYRKFGQTYQITQTPLMCNRLFLPCGTVCQLTDISFHLKLIGSMFSWNNLKLMRYMGEMKTPFTMKVLNDRPVLYYEDTPVCEVSFPSKTDFYAQKTSSGLSFIGNAVIQGKQWIAFQCLWPCEYAASGKPCQFCFSGGTFETLARKDKPLPYIPSVSDVSEIVRYAVQNSSCDSVQITGGSTFNGLMETKYIASYLSAIRGEVSGETLLYITPPKDSAFIDEYFSLGADKIACSLEVWDEKRAKVITPDRKSVV